jgi:two-component system, LytTR family, response regulator
MIRSVIIDDEVFCRSKLIECLKPFDDIKIVGEAASVQEGVAIIKAEKPDLVFLDIQLPDGNGFDILEKISNVKQFKIVFITAFDEYAIRAIKFSAFDYIIKPLDIKQLQQTIFKLKEQMTDNQADHKIETLLLNMNGFKKLAVPVKGGIKFISLSRIIRCQADCNYTFIFLKNNEKLHSSKSLKEFAEMLEPLHFFRPHQSHVINLRYIAEFKNESGGVIVMEDGAEIDVARRRKESLLALLMNID